MLVVVIKKSGEIRLDETLATCPPKGKVLIPNPILGIITK